LQNQLNNEYFTHDEVKDLQAQTNYEIGVMSIVIMLVKLTYLGSQEVIMH